MKRDPSELARIELIPNLPDLFHPEHGKPVPPDLIGAKIVEVGTIARETADSFGSIEGGGLVIDYVPRGSTLVQRTVLGFNELGMWVAYCGSTEASLARGPIPDASRG